MPIGDLLASITGEKSDTGSAAVKDVRNTASKRKAEDEISRQSVKTQRMAPVPNGSSRMNGTSSSLSSGTKERPVAASRPDKRPVLGSSSSSTDLTAKRPNTALQRPGLSSSRANGSKMTALSRTSGVASVSESAGAPKTEPKKRSFAEIMARANAANAASARATLGKIQHKTVERSLSVKERKELLAGEARNQKATQRLQAGSRKGTSSARSTATRNSRGGIHAGRQSGAGPKAREITVEEKKVRKAAVATTGYTGTARPRPGGPPSKPGQSAEKGSELKRIERAHYPSALSSSRRRYDEDEDEMDDFIEYDDEEEPGYDRKGGYAFMEEDESDMEAGISDIDLEERRADRFARREDQEQEALEKRLKREKEERKRKQLAEVRAKASNR